MPSLRDSFRGALRSGKRRLERRHPWLLARLLEAFDRAAPGRGEPELMLVDRLCGPGGVALDVGANHGDYCRRMLQAGARVIAVEPNPAMAAVLRHRFSGALRRGRLVIEACALAEQAGTATLHVPAAGAALASLQAPSEGRVTDGEAGGQAIEVPVKTLDALASEGVDFVKIDVEGFEGEVVAGGVETLRNQRPALLIEAEERHRIGTLEGLRAALEPYGYAGYYLSGGSLHRVTGFDPDRLQRLDALTDDGLRRREGATYINNFLFVARADQQKAIASLLSPAQS